MGAVLGKISIIVSSFNTEKNIARCLSSLVKQTHEDIEILVIDDGSRDNSLNIIRRYAEDCPKIRFFSQKHLGAGIARNLGLRNAVGEYIMFCDAGGTFEPQTCEKMLDTIIKQQVDLVMCYTGVHRQGTAVIHEEGGSYEFSLKQGKYFAGSPSLCNVNAHVWNKIFKKTLIDQFDIDFTEDCAQSQDMLFIHKYMSVAEKFFVMHEPLYNRYKTEDSLLYEFETEHINLRGLLDTVYMLDIFHDFLYKNNIFDKNRKHFLSCFNQEIIYAWERVGEDWEQPFLERLGAFMGKVNIEDWGSAYFNLLAAALKNNQYERGVLCFDELLVSRGRNRRGDIAQTSIEPAFAENSVAVFLSSDNNFIPYLSVTITSLIENSSPDFNYDLIVLHEDITACNKEILNNFVEKSPNFSLRFFSMNHYSKQYEIASFFTSEHITTPAYYRIFAPLIFKNYSRIVYLDCDLVVNTDISELFSLSFESKAISAVSDYCICQPTYSPEYCKYAQEILKIKDLSKYFNSGVLVYNLQKMREKEYMPEFLKMSRIKAEYHDQDILNSVLQDDSHLITPEWNYQVHCKSNAGSYLNFYQPLKKLRVIHFTGAEKPWQTSNLDFAETWWAYARKTPFYEQIVCKNFSSDAVVISSIEDLVFLKKSFWYNRILSKITLGETRKRHSAKKSMLRSRIKALQKQKE